MTNIAKFFRREIANGNMQVSVSGTKTHVRVTVGGRTIDIEAEGDRIDVCTMGASCAISASGCRDLAAALMLAGRVVRQVSKR